MIYETREYIIFAVSELGLVDFSQVLETDANTVRKSIDETKTFVKWDGDMPECVQNITSKQGPYTHEEMLEILNTEEWILSEN